MSALLSGLARGHKVRQVKEQCFVVPSCQMCSGDVPLCFCVGMVKSILDIFGCPSVFQCVQIVESRGWAGGRRSR